MDTLARLMSNSFWEEAEPLLLPDCPALRPWVLDQPRLRGHVLFRTSGSSGAPKHVALSRNALRASAHAVNTFLNTTSQDVWGLPLPLHHVGGFGIAARATLRGSAIHDLTGGSWDPLTFTELVRDHDITLTSLVPTQVYDLVTADCPAPPVLRAVLVGGGSLAPGLEDRARQLGWPLLKTFGMTEAASQIATQIPGSLGEDPLRLLPIWEARTDPASQCLSIRGPALFTTYIETGEGEPRFTGGPETDGWFATSDVAALDADPAGRPTLTFLGRDRHRLKIKGELVHLQALRHALEVLAAACGIPPSSVTLAAVPHARDGQALLLLMEAGVSPTLRARLLAEHRASSPGLVRARHLHVVPNLPRTPLGKIDEAALQTLADALTP